MSLPRGIRETSRAETPVGQLIVVWIASYKNQIQNIMKYQLYTNASRKKSMIKGCVVNDLFGTN